MLLPDPQLARSQVLRVFDRDEIYLLLGAFIVTIGLIPVFFSLLRRRFDPLIAWFSLFAVLYGVRLEMQYQPLWDLGVRSALFQRTLLATGFLVPIPAFFFFRILDLLGRRGRLISTAAWPVFLLMALATLMQGPTNLFRVVNNVAVVILLLVVVAALFRSNPGTPNLRLVRGGLFVFIAGALYDNASITFRRYDNIEPFGFVVLLVSLGIVAARRALQNEQQLTLIQQELEIAKRIQLSLLPASFPTSGRFQVAARYLPMSSVAGDFYDFLLTGDDEAGLLIADVSGHCVPAALISSMVKFAATRQHADASQPASLLLGMNDTLFGNTQSQFVTAGYLYLNASLQELRYSAAAHPPMLLLRDGKVTEIVENGLMLAAFPFATYTTLCLSIQPGDRFMLYTDGMLEAANFQEEEFGPERLDAALRATAQLPHTQAADQLIAAIQQWSPIQSDDLTVILCDYQG